MTIEKIMNRMKELLRLRDYEMQRYFEEKKIFNENKYFTDKERFDLAMMAQHFSLVSSRSLHINSCELESLRKMKFDLTGCNEIECGIYICECHKKKEI